MNRNALCLLFKLCISFRVNGMLLWETQSFLGIFLNCLFLYEN